MRIASVTYTYNEKINLPIWHKYYGSRLGEENLFIVDRASDDGSTLRLGAANVIRIPRKPFDEHEKTGFLVHLQHALLNAYDWVLISDCDELIVPDPRKWNSLQEFFGQVTSEHLNCIGLDLVHVIDREFALDLDQPILSQRSWVRFCCPCSKPLATRVPLRYLPGLHASTRPPQFHPDLFLFHLKYMDLNLALRRQKINNDTPWSKASFAANFGGHHRFDAPTLFRNSFLPFLDFAAREQFRSFDFEQDISDILANTRLHKNGFYYQPAGFDRKLAKVPDAFTTIF